MSQNPQQPTSNPSSSNGNNNNTTFLPPMVNNMSRWVGSGSSTMNSPHRCENLPLAQESPPSYSLERSPVVVETTSPVVETPMTTNSTISGSGCDTLPSTIAAATVELDQQEELRIAEEQRRLDQLFLESEQASTMHLTDSQLNALKVRHPSKSIKKNQKNTTLHSIQRIITTIDDDATNEEQEEEGRDVEMTGEMMSVHEEPEAKNVMPAKKKKAASSSDALSRTHRRSATSGQKRKRHHHADAYDDDDEEKEPMTKRTEEDDNDMDDEPQNVGHVSIAIQQHQGNGASEDATMMAPSGEQDMSQDGYASEDDAGGELNDDNDAASAAVASGESIVSIENEEQESESMEFNDWIIQFNNPDSLLTFLQSIKVLMKDSDVTFRVVVGRTPEDFTGITVECLDPTQIAIVSGRLAARVAIRRGVNTYFTVNLQVFISTLMQITESSSINIYKPENHPELHIFARDETNPSYCYSAMMTLMQCTQDPEQLRNISQDFTITIVPSVMKNIVTLAKTNKADFINFQIIQPLDRKRRRTGYASAQQVSTAIFRITVQSMTMRSVNQFISTVCKKTIHSNDVNQSITEMTVSDTVSGIGKMEGVLKYSHDFPTSYLASIITSIRFGDIKMSFKKGQPLVIHRDFTDVNKQTTKSFVRYLVMPRVDDGEVAVE